MTPPPDGTAAPGAPRLDNRRRHSHANQKKMAPTAQAATGASPGDLMISSYRHEAATRRDLQRGHISLLSKLDSGKFRPVRPDQGVL